MDKKTPLFKILIIGDSSAGKTSVMTKLADDSFYDKTMTTVGVDFRLKNVKVGQQVAKLQIWDTAGQERFQTVSKAFYRGSSGVLIMFDITNVNSFNHIQK